ncbi:transcription initiation factor IIA gamma chain [Bombardia bombarda]|uniref:Transcription initiation factor IIA subunit 2 n=1 Tax=Bombardia bombarda TaxID=252184 RepID=A0AA39XLD5_9PEZI|nr:transcription initiation factor IIA gamma chain [Bombardia bombarda]
MEAANCKKLLFRFGTLGATLIDTLDDLIEVDRLPPQLSMKVLDAFDRIIKETLSTHPKVKAKVTIEGKLDMYRLIDDMWTFQLKDVKMKLGDSEAVKADKLKISACNGEGSSRVKVEEGKKAKRGRQEREV